MLLTTHARLPCGVGGDADVVDGRLAASAADGDGVVEDGDVAAGLEAEAGGEVGVGLRDGAVGHLHVDLQVQRVVVSGKVVTPVRHTCNVQV